MIIVGFFGFLGGCLIWAGADFGGWVNIYGAPATLSSFAFNTLMGLAGGMIGAFWMSKGNPFWMMSGGLAGIFSCASGLDVWYPGLANPGYQTSRPEAHENIPARPPDIIQNGLPLLIQKAPIIPPASPIKVLNAKDDNVAGAP